MLNILSAKLSTYTVSNRALRFLLIA